MQPTAFTCDRCRTPLPAGASVCPTCGQTFAAPVPYPQQYGYAQPTPTKKAFPIIAIVAGVGCLPVIAILAAIMFPVLATVREKARETSSMSNLRRIGIATVQYEQDHSNKLPPTDSMSDFKTALTPYIGQGSSDYVFTEPGYNAPYALNPAISSADAASVGDMYSVIVAYETVPHKGRYTATLYADGHVAMVDSNADSGGSDGTNAAQ